MLNSRQYSSSSLTLDLVEYDGGQSNYVVEGSCVPFFSKFPRNEYKKGGQGFSLTFMGSSAELVLLC
jgi:hypothetical protein